MATQAGVAFLSVEYDTHSLSRLGASTRAATRGFEQPWRRSALNVGRYVRIGVGLAAAGAAVGIGKAIKSAGDFQQQLNILQAVSGATGTQMKRISALSIQLGKDISLPATSAQDAANAMTELVKAGLSVKDAMAAARGSLELATAGQTDVGTAATITAAALNQFQLKGTQATHVADLLAGAANASAGGVTDFGASLKYVGGAAHSAGQPIELVVAALAEMANKGLSGSIAGTSLANALRALQAPSAKAADTIKKYGLNVYDAAGKMKPLDAIAGIFTKHLGDLTQQQQNAALATLFGTRSVQAARVVFLGGAGALDKYRSKVDQAGAAQKLTAAQTKGFSGALAGFTSNVETLGIQLGLVLLPAATRVVSALSGVVDVISKIATAKTPRLAIGIAWQGVGKLYDSLDKLLFGGLDDATSKLAGAHRSVAIPVRTEGIISQITDAFKSAPWGEIGRTVASNFADALRFSADQAGKLVSSLTKGIVANKAQIGTAGAAVALELVSALLDPGFWKDNWVTILSIAIAVFPVTRILGAGRLFASTLGRGIIRFLPDALRSVGGLLTKVFVGGLERLSPAATGVFRGVGSAFVGVFRDALLAVDVFFRAGWRRIGRQILSTLRGEATRFPNLFNRGFRIVERVGVRAFREILAAARGIFRSLFGSAEGTATRAFREIERDGRRVFVEVEQAGSRAFHGIGGAITRSIARLGAFIFKVGVIRAGVDLIVSAFQYVIDKIREAIGAVGDLAGKIGGISIPGGGILDAAKNLLPHTGGIVTEHGLRLAGGGVAVGGIRGRDSVPALLTPGEMVLNGHQQLNLIRALSAPHVEGWNSVGGGGGDTYIEIDGQILREHIDFHVTKREKRTARRVLAVGGR